MHQSAVFSVTVSFIASVILLPANAPASETAMEIKRVTIWDDALITPTKQTNETVYTGSEVTAEGVRFQGEKGTNSVYDAIAVLPGVNVEQADDTGLAAEQGSIRIRGINTSLGAMSVEGIPNYGLGPIGPREYLYDMENIESISVYKGGVPADIGTGVGSRGGAVTLHPKWAQKAFGIDVRQSVGSNAYTKSFLRIDSGALGAYGTMFSGSFSYANADKWRGEGETGPRINANLSMVQPIGEKSSLKLWFNHNDQEQHRYRALTYAQIESNYKEDFIDNPSSKLHYDYNRGVLKNDDLLAVLETPINDTFTMTLKPYYSREDSYTLFAGSSASTTLVQKRLRDLERYGVMTEGEAKVGNIKTVFGYHFENNDATVSTENYTATSTGLVYTSFAGLATDGTTHIHSPYLKVAGENGPLKWQGGIKYFVFQDSDLNNPSDPRLNRKGADHRIWLPTAGISYDLNPSLQVYTNYGKNFIRPYSYAPLVSVYSNAANIDRFIAAGITAQDLFDGYTLETSDTVDLGLRYRSDHFEISPTVFFGKHKNLLTAISDDRVSGTPIVYQQNIGKATSYGMEAELNYYMNDAVTLFVNPTYLHFTYDQDIRSMATKDKQVVDAPKWTVRSGLIYAWGDWEIIPSVRYLGSRYGNALNTEKVAGAWISDLKVGYQLKNVYDTATLNLSLEVNNLFDKEYISVINASDDTLTSGGSSYYQGAPRTLMFTAGLTF